MADQDTNNIGRALNQNLSALVQQMKLAFPSTWNVGQFQLGAAASTVVPDSTTTATSHVSLTPLNVAATTLVFSAKNLYVSARTPGVSFTVSTGSAAAAAGTEIFSYEIRSK